ncbi:MAG TPA: hypothetical protein VM943_00510 [Pyrinomonadaceae bacterium]|nr:hypothetical protein [Pyrinomonadaceae bacterium]
MLTDRQNFVVTAQAPEERAELEELLKNPKVELLESIEERLWRLSIPTDLAPALRARFTNLRLEVETLYPAPQSHPAKQRLS